jgi:integrase
VADFCLSFKKAGFSEAAADIASQARRSSTRRTYSGRFGRFARWCSGKAIDPYFASVGQVADFFTAIFQDGLQARTVLAYRSAIGALHLGFPNGSSVSNNPALSNLLKGMFHIRPPVRELIPEWDLPLVLQFVASSEYSKLAKLSLADLSARTAFLLAIACGRRCSELSALSILPQHLRFSVEGACLLPRAGFLAKNQALDFTPEPIFLPDLRKTTGDPEDAPWCPVRCLKFYLARTKPLRGSVDALFITHKRPYGPVSSRTLGRWIMVVVKSAYEKLNRQPPRMRAHDTRSQASSWALYAGVPLKDIIASAGWKSATTFQQVYLKDVLILKESEDTTRSGSLSGG